MYLNYAQRQVKLRKIIFKVWADSGLYGEFMLFIDSLQNNKIIKLKKVLF